MSDSLRDQLLQAGFKQKAKEPHKRAGQQNKKSHRGNTSKQQERASAQSAKAKEKSNADAAALERKAAKARIKTLIEDSEIKDFVGEEVYRFTLQNRIRELHLKPEIRTRVVDESLSVTRLNGTTRLVPSEIIDKIKEINPNWAVVQPASDNPEPDGDYDDYQVPDDLVW